MNVVLLDARRPVPGRDGASRAQLDLLGGLQQLGHRPALVVEAGVDPVPEVRACRPDVVVVCRPAVMLRHAVALRRLGVPLILFGFDLHFARLAAQSAFDPSMPAASARIMRSVEERCWELADWSAYPDPAEAELVCSHLGERRAGYFPYYLVDVVDEPVATGGCDVFFVGGPIHAPNRDGIAWLLDGVWPAVAADVPGARLRICGGWDESLRPPTPEGVEWTGPLPEDEMLDVLRSAAVAVAPLRFGAGVKRKVVEYLAAGVATITTSVGAQGLWAPTAPGPAPFWVADGAARWREGLVRLLSDPDLRERLARRGLALVADRYAAPVYLEALSALLADAGAAHGRRLRAGAMDR